MTTQWKLIGLAALGTLALHAVPAAAQVRANTHEIQIQAGAAVRGRPREHEHLSAEGPSWTMKSPSASATVTTSRTHGVFSYRSDTARAPSRSSRTATSISISPRSTSTRYGISESARSRWAPYLVAGAGYAWADLDNPIQGIVDGQNVSVDDENGYTLNAGVGAKYFATDRIMINLETRYRYFDALIDATDDSLNTVETTVGVGWRF